LGYNVNVWLELMNPSINESTTYDNTAYLVNQNKTDPNFGNPIYQVLLVNPPAVGAQSFLTPDNVLGDPLPGTVLNGNAGNAAPTDFGPLAANGLTTSVAPLNNGYSGALAGNQGFYVIGPNTKGLFLSDIPGIIDPIIAANQQNPQLPATYGSSSMTYQVPLNGQGGNQPQAGDHKPIVLLRRLLYPSQVANPATPGGQYNANLGPYNPYITVDYMDSIPSTDSRVYTARNPGVLNPRFVQLGNRASVGRVQPYDSNTVLQAQVPQPKPLQPPAPNLMWNTFFRQNYVEDLAGNKPPTNTSTSKTLTIPFNWLPHLDRQLISPVELMHVSAHKPHELTHTFVQGGVPYSQGAQWLNQNTRLFRFFEMVETQSRLPGTVVGGRIPGKPNINTIWDPEVFLGLVDAQPGNTFYNTNAKLGNPDYYAQLLFNQMLAYRSPTGAPTLGDQPFKSFGTTIAAGGDALDANSLIAKALPIPRGINDTILGSPLGQALYIQNPLTLFGATQQPLFVPQVQPSVAGQPPPYPHPYQQMELLTKLHNNVTTHSNTFAVFLTIGFFEVTDETTRPVKLGPEINAAQGTNIRHRVFALVDRTNMEVFGQPVTLPVAINTQVAGSYPYEVQLDAVIPKSKPAVHYVEPLNGTNPNSNRTWAIQSGSVLVVDPNTANEETVMVYSKAGANLFAMFRRPHAQGAQVISRGNPGPWPRYDPRVDGAVVPFFAIID
jgi:hypothetical protein